MRRGSAGQQGSQSAASLSQTYSDFGGVRFGRQADKHSSSLPAIPDGRQGRRLLLAKDVIEAEFAEVPCRLCLSWQEKGRDAVRKLLLENEHLRRGLNRLIDTLEVLLPEAKFEIVHEALHLEVRYFTRADGTLPEEYEKELADCLGGLNLAGSSKMLAAELNTLKYSMADLKKHIAEDEAEIQVLRAKLAAHGPQNPIEGSGPSRSYGSRSMTGAASEGCQTDPGVEKKDRASSPCFSSARLTRTPAQDETSSRSSTAGSMHADRPRKERHNYGGPIELQQKKEFERKRASGDQEDGQEESLKPETVDCCVGGGPGPGLADLLQTVAKKKKKEELVSMLFERKARPTPKLGLGSGVASLPTLEHPAPMSPMQSLASPTHPKLSMTLAGFYSPPSHQGVEIVGRHDLH